MKDKFHKESGVILHYCEIKIDKGSKKVNYTHHEYVVLVSTEKHYCVINKYGSLQLVEKQWSKYCSNTALNKVSTYEQRWGTKGLDDYLISSVISTLPEKSAKLFVKKALVKFIKKEAYFYNGLDHEIDIQLKATLTPQVGQAKS